MTSFERLHPDLRHHIANSLGWKGLREVQKLTIPPVAEGANVVILAPTAGGKTEAAFFPLLSQMRTEGWEGLSVIYLSPIKALLNNQFERLEHIFGLMGYRVGVWHGDIGDSKRRRMRENPPHLLLTTPESLEAMLISTRTSGARMFGDLRAVVIDEVHAFAGDDRGWHLLGVLNRLSAYAGRDVQRLGLSATVGNPEEIAAWLGSGSRRPSRTIDPPGRVPRQTEVQLDWVGNLANAARIIALMHPGERRLVFCDSRIQTEKLARELRARGVVTHVSHSSLSADERRRTEAAFAEGGPGVIVATSALELGIDIGSLDRVIQIDAPFSVASFLQRMGRTGRRPGTVANMLILACTDEGLLRAAAILDLWKRDQIEPARAPGAPLHILAQQVMALALERPGLTLTEIIDGTAAFLKAAGLSLEDLRALVSHLVDHDFLFFDTGRFAVGRAGEDTLGHRHFMELVSVFTTPPVFKVMAHRREIGEVHQSTFLHQDHDEGSERDRRPMVILLAGQSWRVKDIDWSRKIAYVERFDAPGKTRWRGAGQPMSRALARAHRRVLREQALGQDLWSQRARTALEGHAAAFTFLDDERPVLFQHQDAIELWTFAGGFANERLASGLHARLGVPVRADGLHIKLKSNLDTNVLLEHIAEICAPDTLPPLDPDHPLLRHLKFNELLPPEQLARAGRARIYGPSEEHPRLERWRVVVG